MRKCCQLKQQFCITIYQSLSNFETFKSNILQFNNPSLTRNCDNLQNYFPTFSFCPSVNLLSETWHDVSGDFFKLIGYKVFLSSKEKNRSSSIATFISNCLNVIDEQCNSNICFDKLYLRLQVNSHILSANILYNSISNTFVSFIED